MGIYSSIHGVTSVEAPEIRVFPRGEMPPYVCAVVCLETEGDRHELALFAKETEELGVLGAQVMTAEQVVRLVIDSLESEWGTDVHTTDEERRAANNIAQALQGVWVKP